MTHPTPGATRRSVLHGGVALGLTSIAVASVRGLASAASAAVPTSSSNAALAAASGCATLTLEKTEGPYWVDEKLNRSDVRSDTGTGAVEDGVPLTFTMTLIDAGDGCTPQEGAYVDIWQCNAQGVYSAVSATGNGDQTAYDYLRGYQVADENGQVTFTTIWPGWYVGRTVHIHFRIRKALDSTTSVNFTSQLFFEESLNNAVLATSDYTKSGTRTTNASDNIYDASLVMPVTGSVSDGYTGSFTSYLDFDDPTSTATPTATATATATATSTPDDVVDARVSAVSVRRRGKRRTVSLEVVAGERSVARVQVVRHDDLLAQKKTGWLAAGTHTVKVAVPRRIDPGSATVVVTLADVAGNTKIVQRKVSLPRT